MRQRARAAVACDPRLYEILVDTSGIQPRWTTRAYKFKGDKRAGNQERSGWGNDAPSSGCP